MLISGIAVRHQVMPMRVVATQFGVLFAVLAFASQLIAGAAMLPSLTIGVASGAAVFVTLFLADALIDRYLRRVYGSHDEVDSTVDIVDVVEETAAAAGGSEGVDGSGRDVPGARAA